MCAQPNLTLDLSIDNSGLIRMQNGDTIASISPPPEPAFNYSAALYFLAAGHYLFRSHDKHGAVISKFVTANDVGAAFTGQDQDSGWLPPGVVRCGAGAQGPWFVYSAPRQKVECTIEDHGQFTIPIPRTVLLGIGASYYIWALQAKHFEPQADPYKAPFPNVYPSGQICWGAHTPPEADPQNARQVWELFFRLPFNQDLAGNKSNAHKDNVIDHLVTLAESGANTYPHDDLVGIHPGAIQNRINNILGD